ncbi:MAG: DUF192 domain-containing protein [Bdellovibrionaceae bacterium]|nr:DUF192 domain-containing protein [Pseudobdellovibrionaceae bacterium]
MASQFTWNRKFLRIILIVGFLFVALGVSAEDLKPEIKFNSAVIEIGSKKITVELAVTPVQHEKGLMYRETLGKDQGMLFVFDKEETLSFWMKNTYLDLSIAYINKKMKIVDIQEMKATSPLEVTEPITYPSKKPAMYALEMPKGWFKASNIKVGQSLKLNKKLK